jgi:hypothetical protein
MALTLFTGSVSLTTLRSNFDDKTSTVLSNSRVGAKDQTRVFRIPTLVAATALSLRTIAWTQQDDQELRIIYGTGAADAGSRTLTVTLSVDNGDTVFLVDNTVSVSVTSSGAATFDTRTAGSGDYRTTSGTRLRLAKGVRYRLTASTDAGTWTAATIGAQLRSVRRRA